ncbi:MAG: arsenosugar biosynthesis radical SAM protein ArsS [Magnetococcales bacterium]|nr:arsenosugar biosynthesis radical SAM protein ArsS [Magnetococcales bacterium]
MEACNEFSSHVAQWTGSPDLVSHSVVTIQVNLGLRCNLECHHCHVGASPRRRESMSWATMEQVLALVTRSGCRRVDLTGGAPELNPHLREFITALTGQGATVQVRTNLAVHGEPEAAGLGEFFRDHRVQLVGSLPCYLEQNVDAQRGAGSYRQAIAALRRLNQLGYGLRDDLPLNLVYNPGGASLPPDQERLEQDYRRELQTRFGLIFTRLLTIVNMPIGRFRADLRNRGLEADYWRMLEQSFNPGTLEGLMCREQISVAWDGTLFDCDFNLALGLTLAPPAHIQACDPGRLVGRPIVTGKHCLGCTAGRGSSCSGALA